MSTAIECPDLAAVAAGRYKITYECPLDRRPTGGPKDPWAAMVPCAGGSHIYPFAHGTLALFLLGRRPKLTRFLEEIGCEVRTRGDDGTTLVFAVGLFERVAQMIRARKRKRLSPEHRAKLIAAGKQFAPRHECQERESAKICPPGPLVDSQDLPAAGAAAR